MNEGIFALSTILGDIRRGFARNRQRLIESYQLVEAAKSVSVDQRLAEDGVLEKMDSSFSAYLDRLEILALKQKEAEETSRQKEDIWKVRLEENERTLRSVLTRLRYPVVLASWRHFLSLVIFLIVWPLVVRSLWRLLGSPFLRRFLAAMDTLLKPRTRLVGASAFLV